MKLWASSRPINVTPDYVDFRRDSTKLMQASLCSRCSVSSKYVPEEKGMVNWQKQQRKLINAGLLKPERVGMFEKLQELVEENKRINQYK